MARILVSGLVNVETCARVRGFPVAYYPVDYPFFGVSTAVSGVAFNLCAAFSALGDEVCLAAMVGPDDAGFWVREALGQRGVSDEYVLTRLSQTPCSAVLYDESGRRQIYCDLKDVQQTDYPFTEAMLAGADIVAACNVNFNRPLLAMAKERGALVATDVHVLSAADDEYDRAFMEAADVLFLSDEGLSGDPGAFLNELYGRYGNRIIVLGRGARGAMMLLGEEGRLVEQPACDIGGTVVNTVGAGDALFSAFLHCYAQGRAPEACLDQAQRFAAAKIRRSGGAAFGEDAAGLV